MCRRNWIVKITGGRLALKLWFLVLFLTSPLYSEPLDTLRDCDVCPEMIELPMGVFMLGAPDSEFRKSFYLGDSGWITATLTNPYVPENEGPQHRVVVDIPIAMGRTEITYDDWKACVDEGGCDAAVLDAAVGRSGSVDAVLRSLNDRRFSRFPSEANIARAEAEEVLMKKGSLPLYGLYPVVYVTFAEAQSYIDWLNRKLGSTSYRLPTEAEWEFAARAGTSTRFPQGFEPTADQENISGQYTEFSLQEERPNLRTIGYPVMVDELDAANPWGLRHMFGNVSEMTLSCYETRYLGWQTTSTWLAKSNGADCFRTERGGSFDRPMDMARPAWRGAFDVVYGSGAMGFRVVKELSPSP